MARYSRRTGPPADFELTAAFAQIPGLIIMRHFDDGELLVLFSAQLANGTFATVNAYVQIMLDGVEYPASRTAITVPTYLYSQLTATALIPISAGTHTISLEALGSADPGDFIPQALARLTVIQLPLWDSDADIT